MSKVTKLLGGITRTGKGSFPRFNYQSDKTFKKNFERIFSKKKTKVKE